MPAVFRIALAIVAALESLIYGRIDCHVPLACSISSPCLKLCCATQLKQPALQTVSAEAMASGISSRTGSGVGHGLIRVRTDASNLDDFIPHPVARRRRQGGSGALGSALPAEMEKPTLGVILGLIVVLVLACVYALQVSYRLTRLDTELTGRACTHAFVNSSEH